MAAPTSPSQVPVGVDPTRPSIARIYGGFLGGKDLYEVDRKVMSKINDAVPEAVDIARGNRGFLNRACRFLAQTKIDQFLDCGSGLPTAENTHQIVQRFNDEAHVVYVDNDPVVLAHGRALLEENFRVHMVGADIFVPRKVLENEVVRTNLDFSEPIVLLQVGTMHHVEGDHAPEIMREYIDALPSGSYVVFSHFFDPEVARAERDRAAHREHPGQRPPWRRPVPHPRRVPRHARRVGAGQAQRAFGARPRGVRRVVAGRPQAETTQRRGPLHRGRGRPQTLASEQLRSAWPRVRTAVDRDHVDRGLTRHQPGPCRLARPHVDPLAGRQVGLPCRGTGCTSLD